MCMFDAMLLSYMKLSSVCKHYKYGVAAIQHRWNIKIYINEIDLNIVLGVVFFFYFPWMKNHEDHWMCLCVCCVCTYKCTEIRSYCLYASRWRSIFLVQQMFLCTNLHAHTHTHIQTHRHHRHTDTRPSHVWLGMFHKSNETNRPNAMLFGNIIQSYKVPCIKEFSDLFVIDSVVVVAAIAAAACCFCW